MWMVGASSLQVTNYQKQIKKEFPSLLKDFIFFNHRRLRKRFLFFLSFFSKAFIISIHSVGCLTKCIVKSLHVTPKPSVHSVCTFMSFNHNSMYVFVGFDFPLYSPWANIMLHSKHECISSLPNKRFSEQPTRMNKTTMRLGFIQNVSTCYSIFVEINWENSISNLITQFTLISFHSFIDWFDGFGNDKQQLKFNFVKEKRRNISTKRNDKRNNSNAFMQSINFSMRTVISNSKRKQSAGWFKPQVNTNWIWRWTWKFM